MTTTNGWPGKPGVPLHPDKDGWHWVENKFTGDRRAALWLTDLRWGLRVPTHEMAEACIYLGPCLTPDEVTKREDAKWHEGYAVGVLDVRRGTAFGEPDPHYAALQKRVAELEDLIRAVHRNAKNLAGDRTFDQCITALIWIDDLCRAVVEGKKDE